MKKVNIIISLTIIHLSLCLLSGAVMWSFQVFFVGLLSYLICLFYSKFLLVGNNFFTRNNYLHLIFITLPFIVLYGSQVIYNNLTHCYPILGMVPIGILIYFILNNYKVKLLFQIIAVTIICAFLGYVAYPNYFDLVINIKEHKSDLKKIPNFLWVNKNNDTVTNEISKGKILVLDFWTTNCGICFKKFPDFNRLAVKYKSNDNILFASVNLPIKTDTIGKAIAMLKKYDCNNNSYEYLFATSLTENTKFNIVTVPEIIIADADFNIIYKGNFVTDNVVRTTNIEKIIEQSLIKYKK